MKSTIQQMRFVKVDKQKAAIESLFKGLNYYYLTTCNTGSVTLPVLANGYLSSVGSTYGSVYLSDWKYDIAVSSGSAIATISAKVEDEDFGNRLAEKEVAGAETSLAGGRILWEKGLLGQTQTSVVANIERKVYGSVTSC